MIAKVLMEDTALPGYVCEHGLSLYLEAAGRRVLFDMGQSDAFLQNAVRLGVDAAKVELAVLSHGHSDHGGGLAALLAANARVRVYVHTLAGRPHFSRRADGSFSDIGLAAAPLEDPRVIRTNGEADLGQGLRLFASGLGGALVPSSNAALFTREGGAPVPDPFLHEQNLLVQEGGKCFLVAGCAHRGIVNILRRAVELAGRPMDAVIGGFHLSNPRDGGSEPEPLLDELASRLLEYPTVYYTGHCTGVAAAAYLQKKMGPQLQLIRAGSVVELPAV